MAHLGSRRPSRDARRDRATPGRRPAVPGEKLGPTLEEVAGPGWDQALLSTLLPVERAWAWWTRADVVERTGLSLSATGAVIAPTQLVRAQAPPRGVHGDRPSTLACAFTTRL